MPCSIVSLPFNGTCLFLDTLGVLFHCRCFSSSLVSVSAPRLQVLRVFFCLSHLASCLYEVNVCLVQMVGYGMPACCGTRLACKRCVLPIIQLWRSHRGLFWTPCCSIAASHLCCCCCYYLSQVVSGWSSWDRNSSQVQLVYSDRRGSSIVLITLYFTFRTNLFCSIHLSNYSVSSNVPLAPL